MNILEMFIFKRYSGVIFVFFFFTAAGSVLPALILQLEQEKVVGVFRRGVSRQQC